MRALRQRLQWPKHEKYTILPPVFTIVMAETETCIVPAQTTLQFTSLFARIRLVRITIWNVKILVSDLGFFALQHVDGNTGVASTVDCC